MAELTPITPEMENGASPSGAPYISERFRNDPSLEPVAAANWTGAGIVSIVAFLLLAAAVALLLQDWEFLKAA
ncbi:MAG: hypothetical protein IJP66_08320 [Kiritimatiellae bacterium]|nr:hypothetical protein [Kiritimatiellia bacterium]